MIQQPVGEWSAIIPVKVLNQAKSRMAADGPATDALALAFFRDTLAAVRACTLVGEIIVVSGDPLVETWARNGGCTFVSDEGHPGINRAARWAARSRRDPGATVVIVSDLPCLAPQALDEVLAQARGHRTAFVADADGSGTTMWLSAPGVAVDPHFGADSRAAHRSSGAADLVDIHPDRASALATARRDVDTGAALEAARLLGVGQHTRLLLDPGVASPSIPGEVIVTVFESDGASLTVVDESGFLRTVPWALASDAGLRHARPGQRLAAVLVPTGEIRSLRLP